MRSTTRPCQASPNRLKTALDPTKTPPPCRGMCNQIPDAVCEAVFETLGATPGLYRERDPREALGNAGSSAYGARRVAILLLLPGKADLRARADL